LPNEFEAPWLLPRVHGQMLIAKRAAHMPHRLRDYGYGVSTGPLVWNRHRAALRRERSGSTHPIVWAECVSKDGVFEWRHGRRNHAPYLETHASHDDLLIARGPCVLVQRTTAPEQPRRLVAAAMPESFVRAHGGVVIENHLNVVRPCRSPSASLGVVAALLNSETVDTVFRCIGGSVAVSAFELEELPLPDSTVIADLEALVAAGAGPTRIEAVIADAYSEETKERIDVVRDWDSGDPGSDEYLMFAPRHRRSKPSG
jgi:adenine-specific DNA-methyltransferase